jgi:hypothetical protein
LFSVAFLFITGGLKASTHQFMFIFGIFFEIIDYNGLEFDFWRSSVPSFVFFLTLGLIFALSGWGGIVYLFIFTLPFLGYRWLFFLLFMFAVTGTAIPIVAYLHMRFPSHPTVKMETILREALMVGAYADLLAWLQLGRVLTFSISLFIAIGLIIVEVLLRVRESSQWTPQTPQNVKNE